ncbi:MAG: hypothetical protein E7575_00430 [Ruminococcaceae bacterium]|nr:hypothetical protein [Oscillospiraceae bacterium]
MLDNIIIIGITALVVGLASWYVIRAKRKGQKCIGCPFAKTCVAARSSCCSCEGDGQEQNESD